MSPGMNAVKLGLLDGCDNLLARARNFPRGVKSWGLRCEVAAIVELATRLTAHLRAGDPLAMRVKLSKGDFAASLLFGGWRGSFL
jgi:hypothetical protein